jgi:hypothetical protein
MSRFREMEEPLLHVFAAVWTVFPWRASANPMEIHYVPFVTFGAYALHLCLVEVDDLLELVIEVLYWPFMLPGCVSFSR